MRESHARHETVHPGREWMVVSLCCIIDERRCARSRQKEAPADFTRGCLVRFQCSQPPARGGEQNPFFSWFLQANPSHPRITALCHLLSLAVSTLCVSIVRYAMPSNYPYVSQAKKANTRTHTSRSKPPRHEMLASYPPPPPPLPLGIATPSAHTPPELTCGLSDTHPRCRACSPWCHPSCEACTCTPAPGSGRAGSRQRPA